MYPVSRITGERRAEFLRAWGHGFEEEGAGGGAGRMGGATQSVRGSCKPFKGINLTVLEGMHRRPFYRRHVVVVLLCGWDVAAPRGRERRHREAAGGRVELGSRNFFGGVITKIISKKNVTTTTLPY